MNQPIISVLIPTRERISKLSRLLDSLHETHSGYHDFEILCAADDDDLPTIQFLKTRTVRTIIGQQLNNLSVYYNLLANEAQGEYYFILNDDTFIRSHGWDREIVKLPPRCLGRTRPLLTWPQIYSEFFVLTKEARDVLGWIMPVHLRAWGADTWIDNLYTRASLVHQLHIEIYHDRDYQGPEFQRLNNLSGGYDVNNVDPTFISLLQYGTAIDSSSAVASLPQG